MRKHPCTHKSSQFLPLVSDWGERELALFTKLWSQKHHKVSSHWKKHFLPLFVTKKRQRWTKCDIRVPPALLAGHGRWRNLLFIYYWWPGRKNRQLRSKNSEWKPKGSVCQCKFNSGDILKVKAFIGFPIFADSVQLNEHILEDLGSLPASGWCIWGGNFDSSYLGIDREFWGLDINHSSYMWCVGT